MSSIDTHADDPLAKARAQITEALLKRAAEDKAFRDLLTSDPKAALKQMIGIDPLPGHKLKVIEEQAGEICLVLPRSLSNDELPDTLLDLASGGTSFSSFILFGPNDAKPKKK